MKSLISAGLAALLAAILITGLSRPKSLDTQLLALQVEHTMPQYAPEVTTEPLAIQALLLSYADEPVLLAKSHVALLRYPSIGREVLQLYGDDAVFREVLAQYGEDVVLPIHYFLKNEVATLDLMRSVGASARAALEAARALWSGLKPAGDEHAGALSPEERGLYAIFFTQEEGYDFIGQFVVNAQGEVAWVQTERVLEGINQLFAGGIKGLETKIRRDESVEAGDIGGAAVDVAVGVAAFKLLRVGRAAAAGTRSLTFSQRTAVLGAGLWRGTWAGSRLIKYGAPAILAYMALRHPSVINSMLVSAAEKLGLPPWVLQVGGWTLILLPIMLLLRLFLGPVAWVLACSAGVLRRVAHA
jgi:hypothetical protein